METYFKVSSQKDTNKVKVSIIIEVGMFMKEISNKIKNLTHHV